MLKLIITSSGDDWARVRIVQENSKAAGEPTYVLGTLASHQKDVPALVAGAERAGWAVEDKRTRNGKRK